MTGRAHVISSPAPARSCADQGGTQVPAPTTSADRIAFPQARYYATLGELAEHYGGTSNVLFHRSNAIARLTGHPVDILVFGHVRDYAALDREMHADGRLVPGVRFRSMWSELASGPHEPADDGEDLAAFAPLDDASTDELLRGQGVPLRRVRRGADGANLQIDLLRADGSVIVSDRRDPPGRKRSVILCDGRGEPVRELGSTPALRRYWLDRVTDGERSVLFSDTFGMAGFTHSYRRAHVLRVQTFHNHHLRHGARAPLDYTEERYLPFLANLDDFDATVFLTETQRADVEVLMGPGPRRHVVPNSRDVAVEADLTTPRRRTAGVCVSRLTPGKQVDQAVDVVARASEDVGTEVSLDVYGEGGERAVIEAKITALGARGVRLHGHDPQASAAFGSASFSLLTSRSESMSLVLLESMAHGCVPVAYDIRYGPGDIITDGVDGFLVPPGDVDGMAAVVARLQRMGEEELTAMREAAVARAADFSDEAVLWRWSEVLSGAWAAKVPPRPLAITEHTTTLRPVGTTTSGDGPGWVEVRVEAAVDREMQAPLAYLVLAGRADPALTRVPCELTACGECRWSARGELTPEQLDWVTRGILDVSLEIQDAEGRRAVRLAVTGPPAPFGPFLAYPTAHGNLSVRRS